MMAAEYSRELSAKVHAGQCRIVSLGFRAGGPLTYALRRELVDENRIPKGSLGRGQQKNLKTDRVVLKLGPPEEAEVIRRIFQEYVQERHSAEKIARGLNRDGVLNHRSRPWTRRMINYMLRNENYIGNAVYNRKSFRLRIQRVSNPPSEWIRGKGIIPSTIDRSTFLQAQRRSVLRWQRLTNDELLERLKSLLEKEGRLSESIISGTLGLPSIRVFCKRFGSLRNAYRLIDYQQKWDTDWIDRKDTFSSIIQKTAADLIRRLKEAQTPVQYDAAFGIPTVAKTTISLRLARSWVGECRRPIWTIYRRTKMPSGLLIAIRLDEENNDVLDYLVLPIIQMKRDKIRFMEAGLKQLEQYRHANLATLVKAVVSQTARPTRTRRAQRSHRV